MAPSWTGTKTGTDLPARGSQAGPGEEPGYEEHAVKRKERKRQAAARGDGCRFRLRFRGPHTSRAPRRWWAPRPVETSRPKGFSWEGSPEALAPGTIFRNLQHKRQRKEKAVRVAGSRSGAGALQLSANCTALGRGEGRGHI